jgi:hypothetical protein
MPGSAIPRLRDLLVLPPVLASILFILQILKTPASEDLEDKKDAGSGMRGRHPPLEAAVEGAMQRLPEEVEWPFLLFEPTPCMRFTHLGASARML